MIKKEACFLLTVLLMTGCGGKEDNKKIAETTDITAETATIETETETEAETENETETDTETNTETDTENDTNTGDTAESEIEIYVSGKRLSFPFRYSELEELIDLSDTQCVYFEDQEFTVCTVYSGFDRICTLFVRGNIDEPEPDMLVTYIDIDEPEQGIFTVNGLKDDTIDEYIDTFGDSKVSSDTLYDHSNGKVYLSVLFDEETGEAESISLIDVDFAELLE